MPLRFNCAACNAVLEVADENAGKKVRCQKCQAVATAPAAPVAAAPVEPETALTAVEPMPAPTDAVSADPPRRRPRDPGPRRDRHEASAGGSVLTVVLVLCGIGLLGVCVIGVGALAFSSLFVIRAQEANVAMEQRAIAVDAERRAIDQKIAEMPAKDFIDEPGPPPLEKFPPEPEVKPAPLEPPIAAPLKNGVFETPVTFERGKVGPGAFRLVKRFEFQTRADTAYWVQASGNFRVQVRIEDQERKLGPVGANNQTQVAFLATRAGSAIAVLECDPFEKLDCTLKIREMDGSEPLPEALKFKAGNVDVPRIESAIKLNVYDKKFTAAAFSPDNKFFWVAHTDATLSLWEHPGFEKKGSYHTPMAIQGLGLDKTGRLYVQSGAGQPGGPTRPRVVGDISVYENLKPAGEKTPLPAPAKTLAIRGIVERMINSPDGRWLYYLDVHNRKLGRIDTEKAALDKTIDTISSSTVNFCLTPDGKRIYTCSTTNRIDIIDALEFKLIKSVALNSGQPVDIAATNEGVVYVAGMQRHGTFDGNAYTIDLRKLPDKATVMPQPLGHQALFVQMLPDQRAALFSGDRRVTAVTIPARPDITQAARRETWVQDYFMPGRIFLSPDGRTLLQDTGTYLSISR